MARSSVRVLCAWVEIFTILSLFFHPADQQSREEIEVVEEPKQVTVTVNEPKQVTSTVMESRQVTETVMVPQCKVLLPLLPPLVIHPETARRSRSIAYLCRAQAHPIAHKQLSICTKNITFGILSHFFNHQYPRAACVRSWTGHLSMQRSTAPRCPW